VEGPRGFLLGLIIGSGIGALLGLLFAPEPGEVIRGRVRNRGQRLVGCVREHATDVADEVRTAAQHVAGAVREQADEFGTSAQRTAQEMPHQA